MTVASPPSPTTLHTAVRPPRVTPVPPGRGGPITRIAGWISRRQYGHVPGPLPVTARSPWLFRGYLGFELGLMRARSLDESLKDLAATRVAQLADCPFCIAIGAALLRSHGVDEAKIAALADEPDAESARVYTELERLVLEYASAMTATPAGVDEELVQRLRAHLSEEQLVELTGLIAFENYRARFNHALGIGPETYDLRRRSRRRRDGAAA